MAPNNPSHFAGRIEVVCGCMYSGKTEELIRRLIRAQIGRQKVQCFKPVIDDRYSKDHVVSHSSVKIPSTLVDEATKIFALVEADTQVVGIDEVQFFSDEVVDVCQKLADKGIRVVVSGLDMDSDANPFGPMPKLLCVAEYVTKLNAVCVKCGDVATRSKRIIEKSGQIAVGSTGMYEARCRACFSQD